MERDGEKIDAWNKYKYNASTRFDNASCVVVDRNFKASRWIENLFFQLAGILGRLPRRI